MFPLMRHRARPANAVTRRFSDPLVALREEMDDLFERFFDTGVPAEMAELRDWTVEEGEKEVVMRLELPGFESKEIELRAESNVMVVKAEHTEAEKSENRNVRRYEYRFMMPTGTDTNGIAASYRNGILELRLPRLPEAQPKRIEVKS
ncbi:MAG TPA: Hsp20/alpha crystallin family protein [Gemmataceae bacterium]|nr:Hsp20/alpha crystallin family protein [Gemmataceae bacterium]